MSPSKIQTLFRFVAKRLDEPKGFNRLTREIIFLLRQQGIFGFFRELMMISNRAQLPLNKTYHYSHWITKYEKFDCVPVEPYDPVLISVIGLGPNPKYDTDANILYDSMISQLSNCWELVMLTNTFTIDRKIPEQTLDSRIISVPINHADTSKTQGIENLLASSNGEFLMFAEYSDCLSLNAVSSFASIIDENPNADIIYADHDEIDKSGSRENPVFKPQWNRVLFQGQDYIGNIFIIRRKLLIQVLEKKSADEDICAYGVLIQAQAKIPKNRITHIPSVLVHKTDTSGKKHKFFELNQNKQLSIINSYLKRKKNGDVALKGHFETVRSKCYLPSTMPKVSVIIPTRDNLKILKVAVASILKKTDYPFCEVIIVDNSSKDPKTLKYFSQIKCLPNVVLLNYRGPFNYSAIINSAVAKATGTYLCLFNNDIEVMDAGWLKEMVSIARRPETGAVGAKLVYSDHRIQHAGIVLGMRGVAGHPFKFFKRDEAGYQRRLQSQQQWLAVTAACLVVKKSKFIEVDGFDSENLKVAFNDVDFCLKLHSIGYENLYTPYAELFHLESFSRGADITLEQQNRAIQERDYFEMKWSKYINSDPFYSPNLSLQSEDFSIRE